MEHPVNIKVTTVGILWKTSLQDISLLIPSFMLIWLKAIVTEYPVKNKVSTLVIV